jgi:hypothetical protein
VVGAWAASQTGGAIPGGGPTGAVEDDGRPVLALEGATAGEESVG